ncbi:myotubularin-related protein 13-like isoform X4 [Convolutriloba macropyga]|uniref:myotubularin-related protein 13-like isoform X4 n=1 Tax=Convolutriloba macropyga TaxID=536237 RepID=UPI003F51EF90
MASSRLVDYFVIIGYDESSVLNSKNCGQGKVLWQCPPVINDKPFWNDGYSFPQQLAKMAMPLGWRSSPIYQEPTYFCSQLTSQTAMDITFACFTMYEPLLQLADETLLPREALLSPRADAFSTVSTASGEDVVYCPKCLIILSSHRYPDTFKQILCQLYNIGMREVAMKEKCANIETAVANLIGYTDVPTPRIDSALTQQFELLRGLPQLSFIVPKDSKIPVTGKSVLEFFNYVGTHNALAIVIAVLAGVQVILSSVSFTKLTESIHAVISLLYPLYECADGRPNTRMTTCVPALPYEILPYVNSPLPFIYGVHSSLMDELRSQGDSELSDKLVADLDNSAVQLPKNEDGLCLPERVQTQVLAQLQMILDPHLQDRDKAFAPSLTAERSNSSSDLLNNNRKPEAIQLVRTNTLFTSSGSLLNVSSTTSSSSTPFIGGGGGTISSPLTFPSNGGGYGYQREAPREILADKKIRAVFMQLLAHVMHKYRQCLVVVRVHPNPVLKLDKFSFMKARPDLDKSFLEKFLNDNMLFKNFIEARGSPFRTVDLMDHMIDSDNLETFCPSKNFTKNSYYESIDDLADFLAQNETPKSTTASICVTPSRRWDVNYVFPTDLNTEKVTASVTEGVEKRQNRTFEHGQARKHKISTSMSAHELRVVPGTMPEEVARSVFDLDTLGNCAAANTVQLPAVKKRLDGLEKCIKSIFEGRISDVYSGLDASLKILNSTLSAKRLLVHRLREHAIDPQYDNMRQVELNVRLLHFLAQLVNEALVFEDGTEVDHDIVRGVLSIASCYYSRFNPDHVGTLKRESPSKKRLSMQNFSQMQQHMAKTQTSNFGTVTDIECVPPTRLPHQYLCTLIQHHPVWLSHQFWIHAFYLGVEKQLHKMYARCNGPDDRSTIQRVADQLKEKQKWEMEGLTNGFSESEIDANDETKESYEQKTRELAKSERQNAFSQTLDFLNQIVQLQMPLKTPMFSSRVPAAKTYSSKSGSTGRDDDDRETGPGGESSPGEIEKFLKNFLRDAMESTENNQHYTDTAFAELQNIMEQQAQILSEIYTAAKEGDDAAFYPQKFRPVLLPKELYVSATSPELSGEEGVPIRLLADTKTLMNPLNADLPYLPANGNIYLTNYRLIVIAHPRHVLTCDQLIHKSFPLSMLLKMERAEEKIRGESSANASKEVTFHRKVWQFVFTNFQVIRVVFDADVAAHVSDKRAEAFVDKVKELRRCNDNYSYAFMPPYIFECAGGMSNVSGRDHGYHDGREFVMTSKHKSKTANTGLELWFLAMPNKLLTLSSSGNSSQQRKFGGSISSTLATHGEIDDNLTDSDSFPTMRGCPQGHNGYNNNSRPSTLVLERIDKGRTVRDYHRLELGGSLIESTGSSGHTHTWGKSASKVVGGGGADKKHPEFRISTINHNFGLCETYPQAVVVPSGATDIIVKKVKEFYRTHRLPVITWRDARGNGALLIRASCLINSRNVFQPFKKSQRSKVVQISVQSVQDVQFGPGSGGASSSSANSTKEFRDFIRAMLDVIPGAKDHEHMLASPNPMKRSSRSSRNLFDLHVDLQGRTSSEMLGPGSYASSPKKHGISGGKMSKLANRVTHNLGTLTHGFGGGGSSGLGSTPKTLSVPKRLFMVGNSSNSNSSSTTSVQKRRGLKSKLNGGLSATDSMFPGDFESSANHASTSAYDNDQGCHSDNSSFIMDGVSVTSLPYAMMETRNPAPLFIFVGDVKDKKNPFLNIGEIAEIVPVEVLSSSRLRDCFTNLLSSLAPPDAPKRSKFGPPDASDLFSTDASGGKSGSREHVDKWLQQVSKLLHVAMQVVSVMAQGKSVMLCLEDHNDMTAQVASLVQLVMDAEYRTVEGFCTLVDKEWLSFGHRFKYKTGQLDFPSNGFCPTFLLFLDAVNQALLQHPSEFEFNSFFLQTIAYHHMSNRFPTFLGNSELDRLNLMKDLRSNTAALFESEASSTQYEGRDGLWRWISAVHSSSPTFINYACSTYKDSTGLFEEDDQRKQVRFVYNSNCLFLNWSVASLDLWSFYTPESLTDANLYELDIEANPRQPEQKIAIPGTPAEAAPTLENQQSLVNAAVSLVTLQDEVSNFLKRAIDNAILDPGQTINQYYRTRCPQKRPQLSYNAQNDHIQSGFRSFIPIHVDNMLKDLAYKSLSIMANQRGSSLLAPSNQNAAAESGTSSSNIAHQFAILESNLEHCAICKQRISIAVPGMTCGICDVMLHKSCQPQWSRPCKTRKKDSVANPLAGVAMVKSPSFTYKPGGDSGVDISISKSHSGSTAGSDSDQSRRNTTGTLVATQSHSTTLVNTNNNTNTPSTHDSPVAPYGGGGRTMTKNDTMSKYSSRRVSSEKVIMYKLTRHLRQWKKQSVEYYHGRNILRFADPHSSEASGGKVKEIPMNSILEVSIQKPKDHDIVLPNHFDGYAMIRMRLTSREYFLLVQNIRDAEKWADLLSNRIAD